MHGRGELKLTFQELVGARDPVPDVLRILGLEPDHVGAVLVARAKVEQRTGLGEGEHGEQVDEEQDRQQHEEAADVLVDFLLCGPVGQTSAGQVGREGEGGQGIRHGAGVNHRCPSCELIGY